MFIEQIIEFQLRGPGPPGQWCRSLLSIRGDNLQFYPNFALFLTLGGINLDHDFVQVWKFSEDQKNANGTLFSLNSGEGQKKKGLYQQ